MTPAILHRYTFPMREAMAALLGSNQIDAESYEVRVVGHCLVIDIVAPAESTSPAGPLRAMPKTDEEARELVEDALASLVADGSITIEANTTAPNEATRTEEDAADATIADDTRTDPPFDPDPPKATSRTPPKEDRQKGGPLAMRAGIICNEKAFWIFMDESDASGAASALRNVCGVSSRAELDHDQKAAREFKKLDAEYQAWCTE